MPPLAPTNVIASLVQRLRLPEGTSLPRGSVPLAVTVTTKLSEGAIVEGDAVWLAPAVTEDPYALAQTLPEPHSVAGAWVILGPNAPSAPSRTLLSRLFGSKQLGSPRAVRGSALLLRGYRNVGGGFDAKSGLDLCWGFAATERS